MFKCQRVYNDHSSNTPYLARSGKKRPEVRNLILVFYLLRAMIMKSGNFKMSPHTISNKTEQEID